MSETFPQAFGRYQLTERLALGGMAELFLAEVGGSHGFAKTVVIKRILPHLAANAEFTKMFIAEAKITAQLVHPKIAQTFELGTEGKQLFIVMEYIDGLDLLAVLRECARRRVRVPAEACVYILKEVLDALDFAHKLADGKGEPLKIVHRDVSPSNVLLSKRGDVKLIDFGIAHAAEQGSKTKSGTLKGKYGYMSPEQVLGLTVSPKSDIFAAAIVLCEILMGRRLFAAPNELDVLLMVRDVDLARLEQHGKHIDEGLRGILATALRKDPDERFSDAGAFRDALDEWLFESRHRVTPASLADIVDSLYQDAAERRKKTIEDKRPNKAASGATSPPPPPAPELHGVPTGLGGSTPEDEPSLVIELPDVEVVEDLGVGMDVDVDMDMEIDIDLDADTGSKEAPKLVRPAPAAPRAAAEASILEFELDVPTAEEPAPKVSKPSPSVESLELKESEANVVLDLGPQSSGSIREVRPQRRGGSFEDISSAVVSISSAPESSSTLEFEEVPKKLLPKPKNLSQEKPPIPPKLSDDRGSPERTGSLGELPALGALYQTTSIRESGLMVLKFGSVIKEIYFKRGVPIFVSSNVGSELFGAYLVRKEVISASELDMALAVMPHFAGKLGDTLVGLSLIKPLEVFRHLTRQVRDKLIDVCTWTTGDYKWFPGAEPRRSAFPLDLDPLEVYGAGAMAMPREHLLEWFRRQPDLRPKAIASSVVVPELFQVDSARNIQESLDGSKTVTELFSSAGGGENGLLLLRVLFLLINARLATGLAS